MTAYCTGCHGQFHIQQAGGWVRHPSDAVIPNDGEYASAFGAVGGAGGIFNPDIPVARQILTAVSPEVTMGPDGDMVMCLSCHVPYASPYDDLLRWNYNDMMAGGGENTTGCFAVIPPRTPLAVNETQQRVRVSCTCTDCVDVYVKRSFKGSGQATKPDEPKVNLSTPKTVL